MSEERFFSEREANEKVGKVVKLKEDFLGVRAGTKGIVNEVMSFPKGWCVMVLWMTSEDAMAITKDRYVELMEEVSEILNYSKKPGFTIEE